MNDPSEAITRCAKRTEGSQRDVEKTIGDATRLESVLVFEKGGSRVVSSLFLNQVTRLCCCSIFGSTSSKACEAETPTSASKIVATSKSLVPFEPSPSSFLLWPPSSSPHAFSFSTHPSTNSRSQTFDLNLKRRIHQQQQHSTSSSFSLFSRINPNPTCPLALPPSPRSLQRLRRSRSLVSHRRGVSYRRRGERAG